MRTLKQAIEETTAKAKRLLAENPELSDVSFTLKDFPLDEVKEIAKEHGTTAEFSASQSRFGFLIAIGYTGFIHVRSVEVKAKLVYE